MQHLDEITQRPQFNIFTEEEIQRSQEYAPPSKPINDMTTKELKQYGVDLMIHLLGKKNKFSNPANKPYWWPADEPWTNLQSGGADRYKKIICAYFLAERGMNLATICATCSNECTNCKVQAAPSPTERPTTPVPHEPASSTGPPSSPLAPMTQVVSPEDTQPLELSSSPMTPVEISSSMVTQADFTVDLGSLAITPLQSVASMITPIGGTEAQLTELQPAAPWASGSSHLTYNLPGRAPIPTPRRLRPKRKATQEHHVTQELTEESMSSDPDEPRGLQLFLQMDREQKDQKKKNSRKGEGYKYIC